MSTGRGKKATKAQKSLITQLTSENESMKQELEGLQDLLEQAKAGADNKILQQQTRIVQLERLQAELEQDKARLEEAKQTQEVAQQESTSAEVHKIKAGHAKAVAKLEARLGEQGRKLVKYGGLLLNAIVE